MDRNRVALVSLDYRKKRLQCRKTLALRQYWPSHNWSYNAPVLKASAPSDNGFSKAQETYLMQFQFAYAAFSEAVATAKAAAASKGSGGGASGGELVAVAQQAGNVALAGNEENGEESVSESVENNAAAIAPQVKSGQATHDGALDFSAILTNIKKIQPDVSMYGRMNATGGLPARQIPFGNRAATFVGDGVRTGKRVAFALRVNANRVPSKARCARTKGNEETGFAMQDQGQYEDRFRTPVQIDAPFAHDVMCAVGDAMQCAVSVDTPKVLEAMSSARCDNGSVGEVAFDDKGDWKEGAITVHDFKDSGIAVLEAVGV
jgi:hypothetical protein